MGCKYCTDEEDDNRSAKFDCECGVEFYTDESQLEMRITVEENYAHISFTDFKAVHDHMEIYYCPFCGKRLGVDSND